MLLFGRIVVLFADRLLQRRRRWVEISVARAWSHDMVPRLFDIGP